MNVLAPEDTATMGQFAIGSFVTSSAQNEADVDFIVDELVLWDTVLTDDQVSQVYSFYRTTCI